MKKVIDMEIGEEFVVSDSEGKKITKKIVSKETTSEGFIIIQAIEVK